MASTTVVMENQFTEQFRELIKVENDSRVRALREKAFGFFSEIGFPTIKTEDWKYTRAAALPISDFRFQIPEISSVADASLFEKFDYERNGFAALNLAFGEFRVVRFAKDTVVPDPIEMNFAADEGSGIFPHTIVIAESGSKATIVETYSSQHRSFTNTAVQIFVEDNANLTHYRVQKESAEAFHVGTTEIALGAGSRYDATNINLGSAISRHDIDLKFNATGGEAFVDGLYMLNGTQHSDTHSMIDHAVPNCISHQTYKGVLNDKSRAVFNGKVLVRANAHGTDAQQSNKNLLLSNEARVDTKPQLEIDNDDVKCSHGATVGQLEEEELFYLLTRGLPDTLARNLLTYGFAEEIIKKIEIERLSVELDNIVLNRLGTKLEA